jgi:methionyl-tRNA formyltransferase
LSATPPSRSAVGWRVAIITSVPAVAQGYTEIVRALGHEPVAVITPRRRAPDAPLSPLATTHVTDDPPELDVLFPASRRSLAPLLAAYDLDLALCTGFPWLIPAEAIAVPRHGIVNGHPSLLPRYRGPFPISWAVRNGEREIGLSYHVVDTDFDTGNLLAQQSIPLADDDTEETLFAKFPAVAAELLPIVFARLASGDRGDPQEGGDYQSHFGEDYLFLDPKQPVAEAHRRVRAWGFMPPIVDPHGPILERDGRPVRVVRSSLTEVPGADRLECADGPLWILETAPV